MTTLEDLENQLTVAAWLLDASAGMIRDCPLNPTAEHIRHVGEALGHVFDIQRAIYELKPDLKPAYLREGNQSQFAEASVRLARALSDAHKLGEFGQLDEGTRVLREYIARETSERHRAAAQVLLQRHLESSE